MARARFTTTSVSHCRTVRSGRATKVEADEFGIEQFDALFAASEGRKPRAHCESAPDAVFYRLPADIDTARPDVVLLGYPAQIHRSFHLIAGRGRVSIRGRANRRYYVAPPSVSAAAPPAGSQV